jgi:predicted small lipoprotein YifL
MPLSRGLSSSFTVLLIVGGIAGCGLGEGPGGPRELPPENAAVAKVTPRPAKKVRIPKNFHPGASQKSVKGEYAD